MRLFKLVVISFIILFGLITFISLLIPSHVRISKAIDMNASTDSVLAIVASKDQWPLWHPAYKEAGNQYQDVGWQKLVQNDSVVIIQLQLGNKKPIINGWQIYPHKNTNTLTLQWYMDFQLAWYPWQKFSSLFFEGMYGKLMETGLNNIKDNVQANERNLLDSYID